jgi:hypothetical protein
MNHQLHHHGRSNKLFFNPLQLQRTIRIELATSQYKVTYLDLVNRTAVALQIDNQRRSGSEAGNGEVAKRTANGLPHGRTHKCTIHRSCRGIANGSPAQSEATFDSNAPRRVTNRTPMQCALSDRSAKVVDSTPSYPASHVADLES